MAKRSFLMKVKQNGLKEITTNFRDDGLRVLGDKPLDDKSAIAIVRFKEDGDEVRFRGCTLEQARSGLYRAADAMGNGKEKKRGK